MRYIAREYGVVGVWTFEEEPIIQEWTLPTMGKCLKPHRSDMRNKVHSVGRLSV